MILGGASAAGIVANFVLQLLSLAVVAWSLIARDLTDRPGAMPLLLVCCAILAIAAVQLVPIPTAIWRALPPREAVAQTLDLAGAQSANMRLSLAPSATVAAVLATLPAVAAALLVSRDSVKSARILAAIAFLGLVSIVLSVGQVTGGRGSPLYLYEITNEGRAVGFFANKNHFATLSLITLPCLALFLKNPSAIGDRVTASAGRWVVLVCAAAGAAFGVLISGSDAGLLLIGPTVLASVLVARNERLGRAHLLAFLGLIVVVLIAAIVWSSTISSALTLGADEPLDRRFFWAGTARLIVQSLPLGTGLGSFAAVYRMIEDPATVVPIYVNHAHNDYLEIALETGLAGMLAVALFLGWWCWRVVAVWRSNARPAKAASVVGAVMLIHSTVDYPLRTAALMAIFAACCAIVACPVKPEDDLPSAPAPKPSGR